MSSIYSVSKKLNKSIYALVCCLLFGSGSLLADEYPGVPLPTPANGQLLQRVQQLEAETASLRAALYRSDTDPAAGRGANGVPGQMASTVLIDEPQAGEDSSITLEELKAELAQLSWKKGDFRIVPYGTIWGSATYHTSRTSPGPFTLFVPSNQVQGEDAFVIDTRRTRLGLNIDGPRVPFFNNAKSDGRVEIDFHGNFVIENKPGVLLRHAYAEVKNDRFRMLAGQTSDVISPLFPNTINYSVGWAGGNIGYRRAQVRLERYFAFSDVSLLTAQASINQNIVSDFASRPDVDPESTGWPVLEGRLAVTLGDRGPCGLPITVGVSGHIGEQGFDFTGFGPGPAPLPPADDVRERTWSFNADFHAPITERLGVQGEFFTGSNLSTFLGGIVQGVDFVPRRGIESTGGWFEIWYDVTDRLHSHAGFSIDDPRNSDLFLPTDRDYNQFYFFNLVYDVTKNLKVGAEVSPWKTQYVGLEPGESVVFEFSGWYAY